MILTSRRSVLGGLAAALAAPAVVRATSLMPVHRLKIAPPGELFGLTAFEGCGLSLGEVVHLTIDGHRWAWARIVNIVEAPPVALAA